jgi:crotonobetainyl-CoA:carnitine CoA-transferase CaiB-like acyl-CoA transferase
MRAAASIVDIGGATYGVIGILAALYRREVSGQGENIWSGKIAHRFRPDFV